MVIVFALRAALSNAVNEDNPPPGYAGQSHDAASLRMPPPG